jgi:very-short-patch-repair endonuclease
MDKGIWILYLAVGFVEWTDPTDDQKIRTPILLVPVRLDRASPRDPFRLVATDEDTVVNPALIVRMGTDFGIDIPVLPEEDDLDPGAFLQLVEPPIEKRGWRVLHDLALDVFSFHKEVMYRDLLENELEISKHSLVRALALGADSDVSLDFHPPEEDQLDELYPPEKTPTILDADATQRVCLAAAKEGHSFVMDGPPGTGKSQTIANLIAETLSNGKTVLFVSEKIAALEVVKARLDEAGLGEYLLELHSHKATRKQVAQTLSEALKTRPVVKNGMSSGNLLRLAERRQALTQYATALNEIRQPLGRSLAHMFGRASQLSTFPKARLPAGVTDQLDERWLNSILDATSDLARAWGPIDRTETFMWRGLDSSQAGINAKYNLTASIDRATEALTNLRAASDFLSTELTFASVSSAKDAQRLAEIVDVLQDRLEIPLSWLSEKPLDELSEQVGTLEDVATDRENKAKTLKGLIGDEWGSLNPQDHQVWVNANNRLANLGFGWSPDPAWVHADLRNTREFLQTSGEQLAKIEADATALALALGLDVRRLSLDRALELVALSDITRIDHPPEPTWLEEKGLAAAATAHTELAFAVRQYREKASNLDEVFTDRVLDLDVGGLKARFDTVHSGLRKLSASYRADRKAIAGATPDGKASKAALQQLGEAIEWKRVALELEEAEHRHTENLGSQYYQRMETDFDHVSAAIDAAKRAIQLAGVQIDPSKFRSAVGRGGGLTDGLYRTASDLRSNLRAWLGYASSLLPLTEEVLRSKPIESLSFWSDGATDPVDELENTSLRASRTSGRTLQFSVLNEALPLRSAIEDHDQFFREFGEGEASALRPYFNGFETDWADLRSRLSWAKKMQVAVGRPLGERQARRLLEVELDPEVIRPILREWQTSVETLLRSFLPTRAAEIEDEVGANLDDVAQLLALLAETTSDIDEWSSYVDASNRLEEFGCADALASCVEQALPREQLVGVIERAVLERWIDLSVQADGRLSKLRASDRDALVSEFRKLDRQLIRSMAARVVERCNQRQPTTTIGAAGIILREGEKKRRHMPVRDLIQRTSDVAQTIKPCFMMSPLSVSQFLTPATQFDLVVFDEASQVKPADAVNCIYRGKQLVVAGDQKQLPPTSFFERVGLDGDDEYQEDQFDEFESVLDLSKAGGMESLPLRWHYRSQHEDLITYSNYSFYDGKLVTFPGAVASGPDLGVELFKAEGVYRRGGARDNPEEAELVVDRVFHHATTHPDLTLGVVAFSEAQAARIEFAVDRRRADHPDLDAFFTTDRLAGFFVKNLENVQGDERDIMLFSVGYGFDEAGKFTLNFGPLNRAGGERRLNVAITRARRRVEIVTSILPDDISNTAGSAGVRHLRRYLEFARSGVAALAIDVSSSGGDVESPLEAEVLKAITAMGFEGRPQVGVAEYRIDLGVVHPDQPGRFILGVECDGAMYHSSRVARDRDRLRQEILERLGWRMHRVWGPSWFNDRTGQEAALLEAIEDALKNGPKRPKPARRRKNAEPAIETVDFSARPPWAVPYEVATLRPLGTSLHDPMARRGLTDALDKVVEVEGPVHMEVALRRIREANGVARAGSRIREAFESIVQAAIRSSGRVSQDVDGFLWWSGRDLRTVRSPIEERSETFRKSDEIPQAEIQLAACLLVADAKLVDRDELTASVARLFGWTRRGTGITDALDSAVESLLREGRLISGPDGLRLGERGCD